MAREVFYLNTKCESQEMLLLPPGAQSVFSDWACQGLGLVPVVLVPHSQMPSHLAHTSPDPNTLQNGIVHWRGFVRRLGLREMMICCQDPTFLGQFPWTSKHWGPCWSWVWGPWHQSLLQPWLQMISEQSPYLIQANILGSIPAEAFGSNILESIFAVFYWDFSVQTGMGRFDSVNINTNSRITAQVVNWLGSGRPPLKCFQSTN